MVAQAPSHPTVVEDNWASGSAWRSWEAPLTIVVGVGYHIEALMPIAGDPRPQGYLVPYTFTLVHEAGDDDPTLPHDDPNAVRVMANMQTVGYLPRGPLAEAVSALLMRHGPATLCGVVRGGYSDGAPQSDWLRVSLWPNRVPHRTVDLREALADAPVDAPWPPLPHEGQYAPTT